MGQDCAGSAWQGALKVKEQLAHEYWWMENLVDVDESFLRELELQGLV